MTLFQKKRGVQFFGEIFEGGSKFFLRAILEGGPKSRVKKFRQKIGPPVFLKIVSSQTNIMNAIFDQRSTRPPEGGVSRWHRHTHTQTHGHGDSMTNSAQWGRVGEKETTVQHLSRTGDRYCHILTDSVSLVLSQSGEAIQ